MITLRIWILRAILSTLALLPTWVKASVVVPERLSEHASDRIDRVVLHPWLGLPLFFLSMLAVFQAVFWLGSPLQDGVEALFELVRKSALAPLKFKADWKAAKKDFETSTGKKKPSEKVLKGYRKSAGMEDSLSDMDKACEDADPAAYRKAFYKFQAAAADYASILEKALASDKEADDIYHTKCGGLKEMLNSLENRANQKLKMLDDLGV